MKKLAALLLALAMTLTIAACGGGAAAPTGTNAPSTPSPTGTGTPETEFNGLPVEELKVALILNGAITDGSWNANGYNALKANADELGFDWTYIENVQTADMEATIRDYCEQGYNMIIGHGGQFGDAMANVCPNYPDTYFFLYNGERVDDNLCAQRNSADENSFLSGALAAKMSKSGTIGWIGAMEVPTTSEVFDGYSAGAKYVNPDIELLSAYVGSYNDTAKAKELTLSMLEQGADVIQSNANQGIAGIVEAAYEWGADSGIMLIGDTSDQYERAPEFMLTSCVISFKQAYRVALDSVVNGTFEGGYVLNGVQNGVMDIAPYHDFEDDVPQDVKDFIDQLREDIKAGKMNAQLPGDYSAMGRPNE